MYLFQLGHWYLLYVNGTLQQKGNYYANSDAKTGSFFPDAMASQLNSVRLKLEQRRKRIEEEKRKMEMVMARQREKVGQQAFLRAVIKGVNETNTTNKLTSNL